MNLQESITMTKKWTVRRYADHAAFEAGMPTPVVDASTGELLPAISERMVPIRSVFDLMDLELLDFFICSENSEHGLS